MADLNVSLILRLVDKATSPARAAMRMFDRMGGQSIANQAARVQRGSAMMASGLGTVAGSGLRAVGILGDYRTMLAGIGLGAIAGGFIRTAAEFERYNVQLTNLEGSADGAKRAMDWIETFATKTPLQVDETVAAYAKLKAFGIDPMNGTLQALTDTMAATGGGTEQLNGMVLAIGQSWTKGKLQGEEALQLLERGVPVYDLLAKKLGKTTEEIVAMQAAGELGREEIALLVEAMGEANDGAAEDMSKTWDGIISNLWDYWSKFQRLVMSSGVFDHLKGRLQSLLDVLNRMSADGSLLAMAERVSAGVIAFLQGMWDFGAGVVDVWQTISPWVTAAADAVGGFGNAAAILIGMKFAGWLLEVAGGLKKIVFGFGILGWSIAGIAGMAYVIYDSWDNIVSYFTEKIDRVAAAFDQGLLNGVLALLAEFNPFVLMYDAAEGLFTYITGWTFADVRAGLTSAFGFDPFTAIYNAAEKFFKYITGWSFADVTTAINSAFDIDFYAIGVKMISDLWEGMKSIMAGLVFWAKSQLDSITPAWMSSVGGPGSIGPEGTTGGMAGAMGDDGAAFAGPDGARATGGPVRAGGIYRWQENGEEFFRPRMDGVVYNARASRALTAANQTPTMARMAPVVALVTSMMADMPAQPDQGAPARQGVTSEMAAPTPIIRAATAQGGARTNTVNLGGIVIHAAPGQSPQGIAREVMALVERKMASGGSMALHDGGDFDV